MFGFGSLGGGGGGVERLAGRQRGERQRQLLAGGRQHDVVVEGNLLQQLHVRICAKDVSGRREKQWGVCVLLLLEISLGLMIDLKISIFFFRVAFLLVFWTGDFSRSVKTR